MKLIFRKRNNPIFAELRPAFKISQILLVLKIASRSHKSSLIRLHLFNWVLMDFQNRPVMLHIANGNLDNFIFWNVDPNLNQALAFAQGEDLINLEREKYILTAKGNIYIEKILSEKLLSSETEFLQLIGKRISESMIKKLIVRWS